MDLLKEYEENGENKEAYLCGSPPMIDAVIPMLKEKGYAQSVTEITKDNET